MATGDKGALMGPNDKILLDAPLLPDPDSSHEMGGRPKAEQVTDEDVAGSRILIVQRDLGLRKPRDGGGAAVELTCSFHPAPRARFVSGRVLLQLRRPVTGTFIDVAPTQITEPVKVSISYAANGKITLGYKKIATGEASGEAKETVEYGSFICFVRGSGAGSRRAIWDFSEDPYLKLGIGLDQVLAMTVPASDIVVGSLTVTAALAKSGLIGAVRDLVLGRTRAERTCSITLCEPSPR
jgi:hypothetical protein